MLRSSLFWRCAAAAAGSAGSASATSTPIPPTPTPTDAPDGDAPDVKPATPTPMSAAAAKIAENKEIIESSNVLYQWAMMNEVRINNLTVNLDPKFGKGLYTTHMQREGTTLLSVPLRQFSITTESLMAQEYVKATNPPDLKWFRRKMLNAGVREIQMAEQMQLAFLLSIERTNPESIYAPYFATLPHPAIDLESEGLHQAALDMIENHEYESMRDDFLGFMKYLLEEWKSAVPSAQPNMAHFDWSWRTVLARQQQLPDKAAPPPSANKLGFITYLDSRRAMRTYYKWKNFFTEDVTTVDYRLVPTLVPFLDTVQHDPSGNVSVEVVDRGSFGICAELQAIRQIEAGESVGFCYNRDATLGYTLYRFGFIPM